MDAFVVDLLKGTGAIGLCAAIFYVLYQKAMARLENLTDRDAAAQAARDKAIGERLSDVTDRFLNYMETHAEKDRESDEKIANSLALIDQRSQSEHHEILEAIRTRV